MNNIHQLESQLQLSIKNKKNRRSIVLEKEWGDELAKNLSESINLTPNTLKTFIKHAPLIYDYWNSYKKILKI
jgi:hypothetical protein